MSHTIQTQHMEIETLNMELEKSRKQTTTPIINTLPFDNFLMHAQEAEEELHTIPLEFFTKVMDFVETIKIMAEEILFFQEECLRTLTKILEMSP